MKAMLCTRFGGPDDLEFAHLPAPEPGAGEVADAVKAAAINFFDTMIIAGKYQMNPAFPFSPAAEFAGVVDRVGSGVTTFRPGDRVAASMGYGAARERVVIAADRLVRVPDSVDFDRAAGLLITYGTTLHALKDRAKLEVGETLAVLGASGGVGLARGELGKLMGARVIACASSDDKLALARQYGADATINYAAEDLREALRRPTDSKGPNVIYDPVGGAYSEPALRAIGWEGRFLVVGFAAGDIPKLPLNLVLLKNCDVRGVFWGAWSEREPEAHRANTAQLMNWCADGKLAVHIHKVFPLAQTAQALKAIASRSVMGKVVLRP